MGQSAAVIDLQSFRRKKEAEKAPAVSAQPQPMFVPVWVCWVPYWPLG